MSEYDLKKSGNSIGQLYPILEAKDGEIIDGIHREKADKNWKRIKLEHIDTEEKKLAARLVANFHRRIVPYEEKKKWINALAGIYKKQEILGARIVAKISSTTGLANQTIYTYLNDEFKERIHKPHSPYETKVPASQVIMSRAGGGDENYGKRLVERHREEVKQELVKDPVFQRQVIEQIRRPQPQIITPAKACPSGICELPKTIDAGKQVDVRAETVTKFFQQNQNCQCKGCQHYDKCGVIY